MTKVPNTYRTPSSLEILTCDVELGASCRGAGMGPQALLYECNHRGIPIHTFPLTRYSGPPLTLNQLNYSSNFFMDTFLEICEDLSEQHSSILRRNARSLILSGDHSTAHGFVSGMRETFPDDTIGLIWIDAHGDIHSPFTSPTGNLHGMPIAAMLAEDNRGLTRNEVSEQEINYWNELKKVGPRNIFPKLNHEDILFLELRDLETEEWSLLQRQQMSYFTAQTRKEVGISPIIEMTLSWAKRFDHIYVSFDVDALDATLVPGTGCPVSNGLGLDDARQLLCAVSSIPQLRAFEICEINPLLDHGNTVAERMAGLLDQVWENLVPHESENVILELPAKRESAASDRHLAAS